MFARLLHRRASPGTCSSGTPAPADTSAVAIAVSTLGGGVDEVVAEEDGGEQAPRPPEQRRDASGAGRAPLTSCRSLTSALQPAATTTVMVD